MSSEIDTESMLFAGVMFASLVCLAVYCARSGWNQAELESKEREVKIEICSRKAESPGELERCLRQEE